MVSLGLFPLCRAPGQVGDCGHSLQGLGDAWYQSADTFSRCDVSNCQASYACISCEGDLHAFASRQQLVQ